MGGSLEDKDITTVLENLPFIIESCVETGTYKGQSSKLLSEYFPEVHTIEIYEPLYQEAQRNNEGIERIRYYLGDSLEHLKEIVPSLNCPSLYFIDAHISGNDSSWNHKDKCPLFKELDTILSKSNDPHIVLIVDDYRLFDSDLPYYTEWRGITPKSILDCVSSHNYKIHVSYIYNDRFVVVCNGKN